MSQAPLKIVFFDMDGPVCNRRTHMTMAASPGGLWREADPVAIHFLNRLYLTDPGHTRFVMSSDWRESKTKDYVAHFLSEAGFIGKFHADWHTPVRYTGEKGHGHDIKAWLDNHADVTHWVAIDDSKMGYDGTPNLIKADLEDGLPLSQMMRAFPILHGMDMLQASDVWQKNAAALLP